jgi:hypothetical protein
MGVIVRLALWKRQSAPLVKGENAKFAGIMPERLNIAQADGGKGILSENERLLLTKKTRSLFQ